MLKLVEITNGKSFLELKLNELGSYLKFGKPLSINWSDCRGSISQYFAIFSYCYEYKKIIHENLRESFNNGNFIFESEIDEIVKLLSLFENGKYQISYEPDYKYEISENWNWNLAKNYKLYSSNSVIREETQEFFSDDNANLEYITESYYDGYEEFFLFTQPTEKIDISRVRFYEAEILNGNKPVAIIYSGYSQTKGKYKDDSTWIRTYRSGNFIIDGHHKLIAYKKLNRTPSLLRIEKIYNSDIELNFSKEDLEIDLKEKLFPSQNKHFSANYSIK
jgi:hypothetical protein